MRANQEGNRIRDVRFGPGMVSDTLDAVVVTNYQIDPNGPSLLFLAPAGAINVRLPAASGAGSAYKGQTFEIVNNGAGAITLQTSGGAGFATAITVAVGKATKVYCTGNATANLGWAGMIGS